MAEKMQSRSCTTKDLLNEKFVEILELKSTGKLPAGSIVIGRMLHLCKKNVKGQKKSMTVEEASKIVANELILEWVKKNVYPMHETTVAAKISKDYQYFSNLRKAERSSKIKSEKWYKTARDFLVKLTDYAYNIRTLDESYQKQCEEKFQVKMTTEDEEFYYDNCFGSYKATCTSTVPR